MEYEHPPGQTSNWRGFKKALNIMGTLKNEITGTQCRKVREYLSSGASLTQMQALDKFGIARLAPRIYDLHKAGFQTGKKMVPVLNRNG